MKTDLPRGRGWEPYSDGVRYSRSHRSIIGDTRTIHCVVGGRPYVNMDNWIGTEPTSTTDIRAALDALFWLAPDVVRGWAKMKMEDKS